MPPHMDHTTAIDCFQDQEIRFSVNVGENGDGKTTPIKITIFHAEEIQASIQGSDVFAYSQDFDTPSDNNIPEINKRVLSHLFEFSGGMCDIIPVKAEAEQDDQGTEFELTLKSRPVAPSSEQAVLLIVPLVFETEKEKRESYIGLRVAKGQKHSYILSEKPLVPKPDTRVGNVIEFLKRLSKKRKTPSRPNESKKNKRESSSLEERNIKCLYIETRENVPPHLSEIVGEHTAIINREIKDYSKLLEHLQGAFTKALTRETYSELSGRMADVIENIGSRLVVTLFGKPGYGKSFVLNCLISGEGAYPLPSGETTKGKGLTGSVIDIEYSPKYSLEKEMCNREEYNSRVKYLPHGTDVPFFEGSTGENIIMDDWDIPENKTDPFLDEEDEESSYLFSVIERAHKFITQYEEKKTLSDRLNVKRLVLKLPSPFLKDNMIVLRDMPGYDEVEDDGLYIQYIKESMIDSSLVLCGLENTRCILDEGLVRKLWEYGIYQTGQLHFPDVSVVNNNPSLSKEGYDDLCQDTELFDIMKKSFSRQLAQHYNVSIEGVHLSENDAINSTEINFQDKINFVQNLNDNFSVLHFPAKGIPIDPFLSKLEVIIEKSRRKAIDYAVSNLRDMAIVMLTGPGSKTKDQVIPVQFGTQLKKISEAIYKHIAAAVETSSCSYPEYEDIQVDNIGDLVDEIIVFLEDIVTEACGRKAISGISNKIYRAYMNKLSTETSITSWKKIWKNYNHDLPDGVEGFVTRVKRLGKTISSKIKRYCSECDMQWDDEVVNQLLSNLIPETKDTISNTHVTFIYNQIIEYQEQVEKYLDYLKAYLDDASVGTDKLIKELTAQYRSKSIKETTDDTPIEIPKPSKLANSYSIPMSSSEETCELPRKNVCANFDSICMFDAEKIPKYQIDLLNVEHEMEDNVIYIELNRLTKTLEISHSDSVKRRLASISSLGTDSIKPVFITSRPRGSSWKPYLYKKVEGATFIVVTESKYLQRYKDWLGDDSSNYIFMPIESDTPLGAGIVRCCIFRVAQYFKIECIHIAHDDIKTMHEYSYSRKAYVEHSDSFAHCLTLMERVLANELFSLDRKREHIDQLEKALKAPIETRDLSVVEDIFSSDAEFLARVCEESIVFVIGEEVSERKSVPRGLRTSLVAALTALVHESTSREAIEKAASNPQPLIETLKTLVSYGIESASLLMERIDAIFDQKSHIGRISIPCYKRLSKAKHKNHMLSRPTHYISYPRSSLNTYYIPSMENIYPISLDDFWDCLLYTSDAADD